MNEFILASIAIKIAERLNQKRGMKRLEFGTPHGTDRKYSSGCRCDKCRAAHNVTAKARRERRQAVPVPDRVHGTTNGYVNYECRCDLCKDAHRRAKNALSARNREMRNWMRNRGGS